MPIPELSHNIIDKPVELRMELDGGRLTVIIHATSFVLAHNVEREDFSSVSISLEGYSYESKYEPKAEPRKSFPTKRQLKLEPLHGKTKGEVAGSEDAGVPEKEKY